MSRTNNQDLEWQQMKLKEILNYDPVSGDFTWVYCNNRPNVKSGDRAVSIYNGKYQIVINKCRFHHDRLAFLWMNAEWPEKVIHKNKNNLDDRWSNLEASQK